jgi:ABC-type antimicrobial peptide transport system permease subunit
MAIRMALGASRREVQLMVLREGLRVTALGVAIGLGTALALSRVMAGYVYGITSTDPVTLVGASLLLLLVALLASYLPARRATRVNPMTALRYE